MCNIMLFSHHSEKATMAEPLSSWKALEIYNLIRAASLLW